MMSSEVSKTTNLKCLGLPKEISIKIFFFLPDQLLQKLLDYAKIITQKEVRILTFDVHELHISQCWLPELTYR